MSDTKEVKATPPSKYRWSFFRAAGVTQPRVETGDDIRHLSELPDELWTILSCPSSGLQFDQKTFKYIDFDNDGHIRVREIVLSLQWLLQRLKDPAELLLDSDEVPLTSFSDTKEGQDLATAAKMLLSVLGKKDATKLTLADVMSRQATFLGEPFNGDGVVTGAGADSPDVAKAFAKLGTDPAKVKQLVADVVAATGGTPDRSGVPGVDAAKLDAFYAEINAHLAWLERGVAEKATLFPLGDGTAAASAAINAVRAKIDDYFLRCRLASFDAKSTEALNRTTSDYAAISAGDLNGSTEAIAAFPLSHIEPDAPLALAEGVNPSWRAAIATFVTAAANPILGREITVLTEEDWKAVCAKIAPYQAWQGAVGGASVASLGEARLREALADKASREAVLKLIALDLEHSAEIGVLDDLEKFVRFHANLNRLFHNYVNFADYYDPKYDEIFRAGSLYIDGRVCRLCIDIANMGAHAALAGSSKMYLAYCDITRSETHEKKTICAIVTAGFASTIWVGRNGIFYDREMKDWEAVVVKIVEAPVSLKEAFWSPWLKIADMINAQIEKILSSKQDKMLGDASTKVGTLDVPAAAPAAPAAPAAKPDSAMVASSIAVIGVALGAIGSAIGGLIAAVKGVSFYMVLLGILIIFLVVSGPSVLLAWFKMRNRDLAPVLNACGWAVNKKLLMNTRLGREFTHEAVIPFGSHVDPRDPYAQSHALRNTILTLIVVAAIALICHAYGLFKCPFSCCKKCHPDPVAVEVAADAAASAAEAADSAAAAADSAADAAASAADSAAEGAN